jgi:hypothetical protein
LNIRRVNGRQHPEGSAARWRCHDGGAAIVPVHYSMDPGKDAVWAYKMKKKAASDSDWQKEMEINFESTVGQPCFENFSMVSNVSSEIKYNEDLPLRLCCDFNVEPMAWAIAQIQPNRST